MKPLKPGRCFPGRDEGDVLTGSQPPWAYGRWSAFADLFHAATVSGAVEGFREIGDR